MDFTEFLSLAIFNFEFLYPDKEHSSESSETNDKNGFWKKKSKFLSLKIAYKFFFHMDVYPIYGRKFFQAIFNGKNFDFSETFFYHSIPEILESREYSLLGFKNFSKFRKPLSFYGKSTFLGILLILAIFNFKFIFANDARIRSFLEFTWVLS